VTAIGARPRTLIPSDGDDRGFDQRLPYLTEKRRTHPLADWFAPLLPESRAAIFRTICYLFVIVDVHLIVRDPIPLSRHPELYRPLLLERMFSLPPPSVPLTIALYLVVLVGSLVVAANRLPQRELVGQALVEVEPGIDDDLGAIRVG